MARPNGHGGWDLTDEDVAEVMEASGFTGAAAQARERIAMPSTPADLRAMLPDFDRAMEQENVAGTIRQRVLNRLIYGHPHGRFGEQMEREALDRIQDYWQGESDRAQHPG